MRRERSVLDHGNKNNVALEHAVNYAFDFPVTLELHHRCPCRDAFITRKRDAGRRVQGFDFPGASIRIPG